jgi:hypothetical protein
MSIRVDELIEILKHFKDNDEVCACTCSEELIINRNFKPIHKIPLTSFT